MEYDIQFNKIDEKRKHNYKKINSIQIFYCKLSLRFFKYTLLTSYTVYTL